MSIGLETLRSGMYILQIESEGKSETIRFNKM
ncbi:MAG: T9SS type A sorting domain-containing protein [Bacteroidota bacterium]|nr:MAG: T9SS type A sorting domain-containing protein [Bacteroidota bacterium]